jgi:hypothetical protein
VLRALIEQGCSAQLIAKRLRRTESSVRNKVLMQGLSFIARPVRVEPVTADATLPRTRDVNALGRDGFGELS